jgi:hypothetical protein
MKPRFLVLLLLGRLAGIGVMAVPFWHRTPAAAPASAPTAILPASPSISPCLSTNPCSVLCGSVGSANYEIPGYPGRGAHPPQLCPA